MKKFINNRISFVLLDISNHGGVRVIINIVNFLAERGHDIHIYASRKPNSVSYVISPMVKIHYATRIKSRVISFILFPFILPFILSGDLYVSTFYYVRLPTKLAAFFKGVPHCYFIQGIECFRKGMLSNLLNFLCETSLHDRNLLASNRYLSNEVLNKTGRSVNYISVGPSRVFFTQPLVETKKVFDVIYFARREKFKRLDLFLDLSSNTRFIDKGWKAVIVTLDHLLADDLRKMSLPNCTVIIPAKDEELINLIDQSKVMFFTSEYEGLGLPPLECMLRGVPTVTYKTYPMTEYFSNSELNNLLIDDTNSAVSIIQKIIISAEIYANYSKLCKDFVQCEFSENYPNEFINHVQSLLNSK